LLCIRREGGQVCNLWERKVARFASSVKRKIARFAKHKKTEAPRFAI
jgi:hypothetical protein